MQYTQHDLGAGLLRLAMGVMFLVFFPIAVIWLDRNGRVVDARLGRPFRPLYVPCAPARDVLEGPPALLERVHVGDQLRFGGQSGES